MKKTFPLFLVLTFCLNLFSPGISKKRLSVEWIFSEKVQETLSSPCISWLNSGKVLLINFQNNRETRRLEVLDPKTGKRTDFLSWNEVLSELKKKIGDKAPSFIAWPDAVDPNGEAIVYIIDGDLFCIELSNANVKQLTKTQHHESSVAFSPDGKWVSFIRENDIYIVDWKKSDEKRLTSGATETLLNGPLSWVYWEELYNGTDVPYQWSPDSKAIAYLQTDESNVSLSTFVNFNPATQSVVRQRYPKAGQENPKVRFGIVELCSAKTTWINCGDYEYLARFNWILDSNKIAVQTLNRAQSELRLLFFDRTAGKLEEILVDRQSAWINLNNSLYFLKDGSFIWLSERDGYQHLYLYKSDGQLIRQLTKGDFMILSSDGSLVGQNGGLVGVNEEKGLVYFTSNKKALKERHLYRIRIDGTGQERLSREEGTHVIKFSPCMNYYLDIFSNAHTPPCLSLHNADGKKMAIIIPSADYVLKDYDISFPEFHTFKTDDGLELPVMMTKSINLSSEKKYPAIIYVYGGPGAQVVQDKWDFFPCHLWNFFLAQEGYFSFVLEVRAGIGKSKAQETSVYKKAYGMQNVEDILAGVRWIKNMPHLDQERIGLWGWSGGGCTTLYTMTHSEVFKAAIAVAPVTDWHFYDTIYTERYLNTPQINPKGYKETSSVLAASNLKGKLLIVHGSYDDNVHLQNTYTFINHLIEQNISFELMIYPWRKHGITDTYATIHLYNLMLNFWRRNL